MAPHRGAGVQGVHVCKRCSCLRIMLDHTQGHTTVLGCSVRSPVLSHTDDSKTAELKLEGRRAAGSDMGHSVVPLSPSHVGGMGWQEMQGCRKVMALFAGSTGYDTWNWSGQWAM